MMLCLLTHGPSQVPTAQITGLAYKLYGHAPLCAEQGYAAAPKRCSMTQKLEAGVHSPAELLPPRKLQFLKVTLLLEKDNAAWPRASNPENMESSMLMSTADNSMLAPG